MLKKIIARILVAFLLVGMIFPINIPKVQATGTTYYVATTGSDTTGDGSLTNPWKTIQKAADVLVAGDTCEIRGGIYRETVTPANSGNNTNGKITYKNYNNETVTVSGADLITGWVKDTSTTDPVYKASLPWNLGTGNEIFVAGIRMDQARWPNNTGTLLAPTVGIADSGSNQTLIDTALPATTDNYYNGAKIWLQSGDVWATKCKDITAYNAAAKTITFTSIGSPASYTDVTAGNGYYIFGLKALLDTEKEWWVDSATGTLYVWAPNGVDPSALAVEARKRNLGFDLSGRSDITIDGINLFSTSLITNDSCSNLLIKNMKAEYISENIFSNGEATEANNGIIIKGSGNELNSCEFAYSAAALVTLNGSHNTIFNCYLKDGNYGGTWSPSLDMGGSYLHITNNTIQNSGRSSIAGGGLSHCIIEYNDLSNAGLLTKDLGMIYFLNHDGEETEIRYNKIHDIASHYGMGVYLDNSNSGFVIHHNVIWNTEEDAIRLNKPSNFSLAFNNTCINNGDFVPWGNFNCFGSRLYNNIMTGVTAVPSEANTTLGWGNNIISGANPGLVDATTYDLRLAAGSIAIDAGKVIPGITDHYVGAAPDIGAYEYGSADFKAGHDFTTPPTKPAFALTSNPFNNLIANGGFGSGDLAGWSAKGTATVISAITFGTADAIVRNQDYGVKLNQNDRIEQVVTGLVPNTTYTVSGWTKLANSTGSMVIGVKDYGGSEQQKTLSSTAWTQETINITTGPDSTTATIYVQNTSASTVTGYADDISLSLPIVFSTIKEELSNALTDAQSALTSAISIIPAAVKNSFGTVIAGAQTVYNELNSTEDQLKSALSTLTSATSVFKARNELGTTCQTTQAYSDAQVETGKQYEYPIGSKAKLQVEINKGMAMMSKAASTLEALKNEKTAVEVALAYFKSSTIKPDVSTLKHVDMVNVLSDLSTSAFSYLGTAATVKGGYAVFSDGVSRYIRQAYTDEIFEFDMAYDFIDSPDGTVGWPGFLVRSQSQTGGFGEGDTYFIIFKEDVWELQKWQKWGNTLFEAFPNTLVRESNKKYTITIGSVNTPVGVRLLVYVDGKLVFDVIDKSAKPITSAGYFGLVSEGAATSDIKIKATENGVTPYGNLAFQKKVKVSSEKSGLPGSNAVDDNKGSRWESIGSKGGSRDDRGESYDSREESKDSKWENKDSKWEDKGSNAQWMEIDLGVKYKINRVLLDWGTVYGKAYKIQVSDDAIHWKTVYSTTRGEGGIDDISFGWTSARYVRLYGINSSGRDSGYSLWEFGVYGSKTKPEPTSGGNLARSKEVKESSAKKGFPGSNTVDGDKDSRWESGSGDPQWIYVDLGAVKQISRVLFKWGAAYGKAYKIQVSDDAVKWSTVYSTTTGDGAMDDISIKETGARHVKIYVTKKTGLKHGCSIGELEVYGPLPVLPPAPTPTPTPEPTPTPTPPPIDSDNLALSKTVTVSSIEESGVPGSSAVDGNKDSRWASDAGDPQWICVDLGANYDINRVILDWEAAYGSAYQIQVSNDANSWTDVYSTTTGDGAVDDISFTATSARYVRMYGTQRATGYGYSLWEFGVYGS